MQLFRSSLSNHLNHSNSSWDGIRLPVDDNGAGWFDNHNAYLCMCMCMYTYIYIYTCVCMYVYIYIYNIDVRVILSFQQPAFQQFTKKQRFTHSHFKCFSFFQVSFWNAGCWNDREPTLWMISLSLSLSLAISLSVYIYMCNVYWI